MVSEIVENDILSKSSNDMSSYNELIALINGCINRNGVQAITGRVLNGVLRAMVNQLGAGYAMGGVAHPTDDPGTPEAPVCYYASEVGTYTHFGNIQIVPGELALLCFDLTDGWFKETMYEGFESVQATIDGNVGTPAVNVTYVNGVLSFDFSNMKGNTGAAAGFGNVTAAVDGTSGTPGVSVQTDGPDTAKNIAFQFTGLKGETGVTSVIATVDNTSGTPQCAVSLNGQQLTLAFTGLKGAQGDTGSSVAYPFTIVNNLTTNDATQALSAAMGVQLESEVSQLEAKVSEMFLDIGLADVNIDIHYSVTNNLSNCTTDNDDTTASLGETYEATITPDDGYDLSSVAVLMGNEDITEDVYDGEGGISIPVVEGDITITAIAVEHGVTVVTFADPIVEQIAYAQGWDDNGIFTTDSLAAVTRIDAVFKGAGITTFDEFRYFTGIRRSLNQLALGAFADNPDLESIILPEGIDFYGTNVFANCSKLTSIVIPNSALSIPSSTFRYCTGLTSIDLGSGITSIGNLWVGNSNNALKTLICRAATPPTSDWSLFNATALEHIYVPAASVDAYKAAANWSAKASIIEAIPE